MTLQAKKVQRFALTVAFLVPLAVLVGCKEDVKSSRPTTSELSINDYVSKCLWTWKTTEQAYAADCGGKFMIFTVWAVSNHDWTGLKKGEQSIASRVESSSNQSKEYFETFDMYLRLNKPLAFDVPKMAKFKVSGYIPDWNTAKGKSLVDVEFESSEAEMKAQERPSAPAQTAPKEWAGCIDVKRLHQVQYHEGGCNFMTVAATSGLTNAQIEAQRRQCYAAHGFSDWERVQSCFR